MCRSLKLWPRYAGEAGRAVANRQMGVGYRQVAGGKARLGEQGGAEGIEGVDFAGGSFAFAGEGFATDADAGRLQELPVRLEFGEHLAVLRRGVKFGSGTSEKQRVGEF